MDRHVKLRTGIVVLTALLVLATPPDLMAPKYHYANGAGNPFYQIDETDEIQPTEEGGYNNQPTYREDGY